MSKAHVDSMMALWNRASDSWRKSNLESNIVQSERIAGHEVTATVHYVDGRTSWKLNGKRSSFSAIHSALIAA